jgi:aminomethyltransferase
MQAFRRIGQTSSRVLWQNCRNVRHLRALAAGSELRKTPLYELNVELGGTMVEFGGWAMPVKYPGKEGGIMGSHMHTRSEAGLFDVSHMVPIRFYGKDRAKFMETFLVGDIQELPENMGTLSLITNAQGGLIDDCICTNAGDHMCASTKNLRGSYASLVCEFMV